jgi:alkanesulfonate monooxygenase SsuD/methylene tetrahydromethanopterin reductase-like flavin-dependent oxidoreductase (luciferase family)
MTERIAIFATCHMAAYLPALAAKQAATVDHISGGRLGLNLVAGWHKPESDMLGVKFGEHGERYEQAAEWTEIVQRLWTSADEFDYKGRYYDIVGAHIAPRPAQDPWPALMNAGGSDSGRDFCVSYMDMGLIQVESEDAEVIAAQVSAYRALAAEKGREIQVWTPVYVIQGDTDADAAMRRERITEQGDYAAAKTQIDGLKEAWHLDEQAQRALTRRLIEGGGGWPVIGAPATIADRLEMLCTAGLDGVLMSWIDFVPGIRRFADDVLPLLEQRGLRKPYSHATVAALPA